MKADVKNIAFILARGGSKRLPKKNIKLLDGKPLISYALSVANLCKDISDIVVSSDCSEILSTAKSLGNCFVLKRPDFLAQDDSTSEDALFHAVQWYEENCGVVDNIVLLQPTSPFSSPDMISQCINLLKTFDSSMTVVSATKRYEWFGTISDEGAFHSFLDETEKKRFSNLKQFIPSGNVYAVRKQYFLKNRKLRNHLKHGVHIVSPNEAVDIDLQSDFDYAQFLLANTRNDSNGDL